jgi:hypothetical protein
MSPCLQKKDLLECRLPSGARRGLRAKERRTVGFPGFQFHAVLGLGFTVPLSYRVARVGVLWDKVNPAPGGLHRLGTLWHTPRHSRRRSEVRSIPALTSTEKGLLQA